MKKVIIVDDSPSELALMNKHLEEEGYSVISCSDAKEAIEKAHSQNPDVVVTDLVMPGMSGLELCRSIKKNDETKSLPVIACTSKGQDLDKLWGKKQGINVYITKPYSKEEFIRAVKSVTI